jgi:hypothetical protein
MEVGDQLHCSMEIHDADTTKIECSRRRPLGLLTANQYSRETRCRGNNGPLIDNHLSASGSAYIMSARACQAGEL